MRLKKLFLGIFLIGGSCLLFGQNPAAGSRFWDNVRFGGGLGLSFTNGGFNGSISPSAIYQFNDQIAVGTSLSFNYAKFNENKFLAYGGSVLSLFNPIPQIQLSGEFEALRINRTLSTNTVTFEDNYWLPALYFGAGYSTANVTVGLRYDVLFNENKSIYPSALLPFIRVYF